MNDIINKLPKTPAGRLAFINEFFMPRPSIDEAGDIEMDDNGGMIMLEPIIKLSDKEIIELLDLPAPIK